MEVSSRADSQSTNPTYDLGVLFVHGIGDQAKGSTLVDFGTPLYEWLADRANAVGCTVEITDAVVMPGPEVPAHSEFRIQAVGVDRRWLLAEAWWAESFATPRFADFARWGLGVVPRTFGSHFGAGLVRAWRSPKATAWEQFTRIGRVAGAFINLIVGIALSFFMLVFLLTLLVVGLIPIRRLREAIAKVQLRLASSIGDCYVLVVRPIESVAILSRFIRNLSWLESRCHRVAIVAHSQGGAVACLALRTISGSSTRLLVTFGSGLRKLQELSELRSRPSFRRGALLTVFGFVVASYTLLFLPVVIQFTHNAKDAFESRFIWAVLSVIGWTILIAGLRDFILGLEPEKLQQVGKDLRNKVTEWKDIYASADPVPNGPLHEDKNLSPSSIAVVNYSSIFRDHVSYWRNYDEFLARLADCLLRFDGSLAKMCLPDDTLEFLKKRRAARVNHLRFAWWIALLFALALLFRYSAEWAVVIAWASHRAPNWIMGALGLHTKSGSTIARPLSHDWWWSVGTLALVLAAYLVTRGTWSHWNRLEMHEVVRRLESQWLRFLLALWLLLVVGASTLAGDFSGWITFASFAVLFAFMFAPWPDAPEGVAKSEKGTHLAEARAEVAARFFWKLFSVAVPIVGIPLFAFDDIRAIHKYLCQYSWMPAGGLSWLFTSLVLLALWVFGSLIVGLAITVLFRAIRKSST